MTGAQVRQARHLLGLSVNKLAAQCGFGGGVIRMYENTGKLAKPMFHRTRPEDRHAIIQAALEAAGVVFTDGEEPGVKVRKVEA